MDHPPSSKDRPRRLPLADHRFIDESPEFIFVSPEDVITQAAALGAIPYDVENVELSHIGPLCSFDAFLLKYELNYPALAELALIVRGADTDTHSLHPACAGLFAISLGLSHNFEDDHEQLRHGFVMYDALYSWCRDARNEKHNWNPQSSPTPSP